MGAESFTADEGRLDAVIARLSGLSRADVQRAIDGGRVLVDGEERAKSFRLHGGRAARDRRRATPVPLAAEGPPVPIRYEDDSLLVIDKPAGLITHPTEQRRSGTLVNRLLGMGVSLSSAGGDLRPGIVHRLDAGTSGLMVVAKTDEAHEALARMMREHSVERRYLTLVRGRVEHDAFAVDAPLGRRADRVVVDHVEGRAARDGVRGPRADGVRHVARSRAAHGPHPSDPRAPAGDRAPDPGRPGVRGWWPRRDGARARAAVPAFVEDRVRPSAHGERAARTGRGGTGTARRRSPTPSSEPGRRATDLAP